MSCFQRHLTASGSLLNCRISPDAQNCPRLAVANLCNISNCVLHYTASLRLETCPHLQSHELYTQDVLTAIDLSKKTFRRIWLNYFWTFCYNVSMMPLAAGMHASCHDYNTAS